MDKWASQFSSYQDMPGLIGAVFNTKGKVITTAAEVGMKQSIFDTATNVGGRLLQFFEIQNSQRIIGKATPDAMTHLIRTVMPKVDELLQAGLPSSITNTLGERIINSFGDVEKARLAFVDEVVKFGSIDKLKQMDWLDDGIKSLFSEFNDVNVWDKITDTCIDAPKVKNNNNNANNPSNIKNQSNTSSFGQKFYGNQGKGRQCLGGRTWDAALGKCV